MDRRNTLQKQIVLNAVRELAHHATANEIYDLICLKFPQIGRATVYRDLNVLSQEGKIRKIDILGEASRYDHTIQPHYHAKCVRCEKIFDVDLPYKKELDEWQKEGSRLKLLGHQIVFDCICEECQKYATDPERDEK